MQLQCKKFKTFLYFHRKFCANKDVELGHLADRIQTNSKIQTSDTWTFEQPRVLLLSFSFLELFPSLFNSIHTTQSSVCQFYFLFTSGTKWGDQHTHIFSHKKTVSKLNIFLLVLTTCVYTFCYVFFLLSIFHHLFDLIIIHRSNSRLPSSCKTSKKSNSLNQNFIKLKLKSN